MKNKQKLTINIFDEDVFIEYGVDGEETLQDELTDTIEKKANTQKLSTELEINVVKPENSKINNEQFALAFKNTFKDKINTVKHECSRCVLTGLILLMVGIGMLALDVFVLEPLNYFVYEFFNVFAWVFCWGGIEVLTIELTQLIIEIKKSKRILNSTLTLENTHKKEKQKK